MQEAGNKFTSTKFRFCPSRRLSFELTTVFQYVRHVHHGKDSFSDRCSQRHWFGMRQGAPKNGAEVSYIGWLHCHVREVVETRFNSHDTLRGSGCFVEKQSFCLLRKYAYETPEYVTEVLHGSTLHFKTVIANCCNFSDPRFLPRHFIFTHKQNINVFKM